MPLTVCTSSTEGQFAELGDLMLMLGATASSCGMDLSLTQATQWAETYLGYPLGRQVYQETLAAYGTRKLMVDRTPLRGVQRLFDSTDTGSATELTSTEYRLQDPEAGFIERDAGWRWTAQTAVALTTYIPVGSETRPWLVVYEAGYTLAETSSTDEKWATTSTGRTLPGPIEQAILVRAAELYEGAGSGQVSSMKVGPLTLTTRSEMAGVSSDNTTAEGMLTAYRRVKY
jgi:hypothetical protein